MVCEGQLFSSESSVIGRRERMKNREREWGREGRGSSRGKGRKRELEREGREGECVVTVCTCNVTLYM